MPWSLLGILAIVCAVLSSVGFYKFVYFLSIGYGFAVAGGGIAIFVMALVNPTDAPIWILLIQAALFVAYGIRLSGFLLVRELKTASYKKTFQEVSGDGKKMPFFVLFTIWVSVTVLYVAQVSPMLFRYDNGASDLVLPLVGIVISILGLVLESVADNQKSAQKKVRPDMVATQGLYKLCRCPNYLGEITVWWGVAIACVFTVGGAYHLCLGAIVNTLMFLFVSIPMADKRQSKKAGFEEYKKQTRMLFPIPKKI